VDTSAWLTNIISLSRTQVGSSIKETPLLFPVDLFEHPAFREDVERILSSSSSSSSAIGRVELVADDGKKVSVIIFIMSTRAVLKRFSL
jgi:hypothetical protein